MIFDFRTFLGQSFDGTRQAISDLLRPWLQRRRVVNEGVRDRVDDIASVGGGGATRVEKRSVRAPDMTRAASPWLQRAVKARILPRARTSRLFEQLLQILKHGVFFLRARAIGEKELLDQVQCLSLRCGGIEPVPYGTQELISVHLTFSRVPRVTNRSRIKLIEWYPFRVPIEFPGGIGGQPVLREHD